MVAVSTNISKENTNPRILKKLHEKIIKDFLDTIILKQLCEGPQSGYDIMRIIHSKFGFLASSGTVYSLLYSLERNGLISGIWVERKRVYKLTVKGQQTIEDILLNQEQIKAYIGSIFS